MCLAQGPQRSDAGESRVKYSTTEPLRSLVGLRFNITVNLVFGHAGSLSLLFGRFNITVS